VEPLVQEDSQYVVSTYLNGYITGIGEDIISGMTGFIANGGGIIGITVIIMPLLQQFKWATRLDYIL